jgi:hypothetical protein
MKEEKSLNDRASEAYAYGKFTASTFAPQEVVLERWDSKEGKARLFRSENSSAFFALAPFFQPQLSPVYCGIASAVMVLNALRCPTDSAPHDNALPVMVPETNQTIALRAYSQLSFLNESTEAVKPKAVIEHREKDTSGKYRPGLSLMELRDLLRAYRVQVEAHFASESGEQEFRRDFERAEKRQSFVIIHFRSDLMGGIPRGHISPLAAWDRTSDSVLIMDVASHKGPWYWAPVSQVFQAMSATYDTQPSGGGWLEVRN